MCPDCGKPSSGFKQCRACRSHHGTVQAVLRTLDVLGNKHIPAIYLRSSQDQRCALLAGLLDSDGTVTRGELEAGLRQNFRQADADHDGRLNPDEAAVANARRIRLDESTAMP